jgi:hypothetical protein
MAVDTRMYGTAGRAQRPASGQRCATLAESGGVPQSCTYGAVKRKRLGRWGGKNRFARGWRRQKLSGKPAPHPGMITRVFWAARRLTTEYHRKRLYRPPSTARLRANRRADGPFQPPIPSVMMASGAMTSEGEIAVFFQTLLSRSKADEESKQPKLVLERAKIPAVTSSKEQVGVHVRRLNCYSDRPNALLVNTFSDVRSAAPSPGAYQGAFGTGHGRGNTTGATPPLACRSHSDVALV